MKDSDERTHEVPTVKCPMCAYEMDRATSLAEDEPRRPRDGDGAICVKCGEFLVYRVVGENMSLARASPFDWRKLDGRQREQVRVGQAWIRAKAKMN